MELTEAADIIQKRMNCRNANKEVCKITKCDHCSNYLDIEEAYIADEIAVKAIKYCMVRGVSLITNRDAEMLWECSTNTAQKINGTTVKAVHSHSQKTSVDCDRRIDMANTERLQKPTRDQKKLLSDRGLVWQNWLVPRGGEDNLSLAVVNKNSGKRKVILK